MRGSRWRACSCSAAPSPKTANSVEIGFTHATVLSLGPQDQWVLDPASDKRIMIESLTGELKRGGKLSGKITGAIANGWRLSGAAVFWDAGQPCHFHYEVSADL